MVWIGLHGVMFLFLFSDFYKSKYTSVKSKLLGQTTANGSAIKSTASTSNNNGACMVSKYRKPYLYYITFCLIAIISLFNSPCSARTTIRRCTRRTASPTAMGTASQTGSPRLLQRMVSLAPMACGRVKCNNRIRPQSLQPPQQQPHKNTATPRHQSTYNVLELNDRHQSDNRLASKRCLAVLFDLLRYFFCECAMHSQ